MVLPYNWVLRMSISRKLKIQVFKKLGNCQTPNVSQRLVRCFHRNCSPPRIGFVAISSPAPAIFIDIARRPHGKPDSELGAGYLIFFEKGRFAFWLQSKSRKAISIIGPTGLSVIKSWDSSQWLNFKNLILSEFQIEIGFSPTCRKSPSRKNCADSGF